MGDNCDLWTKGSTWNKLNTTSKFLITLCHRRLKLLFLFHNGLISRTLWATFFICFYLFNVFQNVHRNSDITGQRNMNLICRTFVHWHKQDILSFIKRYKQQGFSFLQEKLSFLYRAIGLNLSYFLKHIHFPLC